MVDSMETEPQGADALEAKLAGLREQIDTVSECGLLEVALQVKHAEIQSEYWRTKQLLADLAGDNKEARYCSRESLSWEEQKTRAIKYGIADRLTALEDMATQSSDLRQGLRLLAGGS